MNTRITQLNLHIGRLSVDGVTVADNSRVCRALENRLSGLLNNPSAPPLSGHLRMDQLSCQLPKAGASPAEIGRLLADSIFARLGGEPNG
ncbi:MAG: hypothetical protein WCL60_01465 [Methylococcales bacterium]|jgi:hypothetical protein